MSQHKTVFPQFYVLKCELYEWICISSQHQASHGPQLKEVRPVDEDMLFRLFTGWIAFSRTYLQWTSRPAGGARAPWERSQAWRQSCFSNSSAACLLSCWWKLLPLLPSYHSAVKRLFFILHVITGSLCGLHRPVFTCVSAQVPDGRQTQRSLIYHLFSNSITDCFTAPWMTDWLFHWRQPGFVGDELQPAPLSCWMIQWLPVCSRLTDCVLSWGSNRTEHGCSCWGRAGFYFLLWPPPNTDTLLLYVGWRQGMNGHGGGTQRGEKSDGKRGGPGIHRGRIKRWVMQEQGSPDELRQWGGGGSWPDEVERLLSLMLQV